jgi:fibronectin-binding autotransporter adhesin
MRVLLITFSVALAFPIGALSQSVFIPPSGTQSWNVATNWTPASVPNAVGAAAAFNSPTAAQTVNLAAAITAGSIAFTNNGAAVLTLANGTGGSLTMDQDGGGPGEATIVVNGTSATTNHLSISASVVLTDDLRVTVNNTAVSTAGAATFTGAITGGGDFIKDGPGRLSMTSLAKAYTGATIINQGRLRFTATGVANATSGITVNSGGQLTLDSGTGTFNFGSAIIILNGAGTTEVSQFAGALRNNGSGTSTLANAITLASDATIHVDGGSNTLTANGAFSGSFILSKSGGGTLSLTNANTGYTGGTAITNGTIAVQATSQLGTGSLTFAQSTTNNATLNLLNATQSIGSLSSIWVDTTGTLTQSLNLTGTALSIDQTVDGTFGPGAVSTLQSLITGTGSISKSGVGTLTLGGANTYSGGTTIASGTVNALNATGSATGTGNVTISAASIPVGRLSGTGRVAPGAGNFVYANGTLHVGDVLLSTPVASQFTVDVSGTGSELQTAPTTKLEFDLFGGAGSGVLNPLTQADVLMMLGLLNSSGGGTVVVGNPTGLSGFTEGDAWTLVDLTAGTISNDLAVDYSSLALDPGLVGEFNRTTGVFSIVSTVVIPEPSRVVLAGLGLMLIALRRSRRAPLA